MESPNRTYLPAVDHLRAFAALLILFYHCYHLFSPPMVLHREWQSTDWVHTKNFLLASVIEGHTAVSLFLVISGFILTYGSLGRNISYRGFYWNRFLRLFPLFFFILITGANAFRSQFQIGGFLTSVLQFGYLSGGLEFGAWTGVLWSVSVESHLYLLFPAIRHFLSSNRLWPLLQAAVLIWVARLGAMALGANILDVTYWTALGRADQFLAGALLAWLLHRYGIPRRLAFFFPAILLGAMAVLYGFHRSGGYPAQQEWRVAWPTIEAVVWTAFVAAYLGFVRYVPLILDIVLRFLGRISYSIYLVHAIVVWIFARKGWYFTIPALSVSANIFLTAVVGVLPVVVLVSTLTYYTIEQPFLSMRKRYNMIEKVPVSV
ncbi:MAG: acyltransferase [Acidobacteriia bacterium]|nr:acyltransferase [Terriglobia bacterium]